MWGWLKVTSLFPEPPQDVHLFWEDVSLGGRDFEVGQARVTLFWGVGVLFCHKNSFLGDLGRMSKKSMFGYFQIFLVV